MKPLERFRLRLSRSDALLAISVVGMTAGFTTGTVAADASFSQRSVYLTLMGAAGFEYRRDPMARLLNRTGVGAVIEREFAITPRSG